MFNINCFLIFFEMIEHDVILIDIYITNNDWMKQLFGKKYDTKGSRCLDYEKWHTNIKSKNHQINITNCISKDCVHLKK